MQKKRFKPHNQLMSKIAYFLCFLGLVFYGLEREANSESTSITNNEPEIIKNPTISGRPVKDLQSFDRVVTGAMVAWNIPGGSVAVAKNGKIIYAKGFGLSDNNKTPVLPETLFRIASVSKIITGMTILKLKEEKKLSLEDSALEILKNIINKQSIVDQDWNNIKVKNLLRHDSGVPLIDCASTNWLKIAADEKIDKHATPQAVLSYLVKQRLENKPGSQFQYNNNNFLILGRIIEQVTGQTYEQYVKNQILKPMGIVNMKIGKTLKKDKDSKEVDYDIGHTPPIIKSVYPEQGEFTQSPYGAWSMELCEAYGGWIASAADIVRFVSFFDGFEEPADLISKTTWTEMTTMPDTSYNKSDKDWWQGLAWCVRKNGQEYNYWHCGVLDETRSEVVRTADGFIWCWIFNGNTDQNVIDSLMWLARSELKKIPVDDLAPAMFPDSQ